MFSCGLIATTELSGFKEAKMTACVSFGYVCMRIWKDKIPSKIMAIVWNLSSSMLFGPAGASLLISNIQSSDVGSSFIIVCIGFVARMLGVLLATVKQGYSLKERAYVGATWFGKGSITALLGGVVLAEATSLGEEYSEYRGHGIKM